MGIKQFHIDFYPVSGDGEYGFYAMDFAGMSL